MNSRAGLAVQPAVFSSVRFSGVLFVNSTYDNDLVGIIFGYQNHKNFYTLTSSMTGSRQVHNDQLESVFHEKTGLLEVDQDPVTHRPPVNGTAGEKVLHNPDP